MHAAENGDLNIVRILVENGATVNLQDESGATAASIAYDKGESEIYDYLKKHGAIDLEPKQLEAPGQRQSSQTVAYSVSVNSIPTGPFSIAELKIMAQKGELTRDTLVWKEGMPQWAKAVSVKELEPVFGAVPPPLPPR